MNAAICVISFDGSSDLWEPFFNSFSEAWPENELPIYLVSNFLPYNGRHDVKSLTVGEDIDWSSNLLSALNQIDERHILFIFDDFFVRSINTEKLTFYMDRAIKNDWPYLTFHPNNYLEKRVEPGIRSISENGIYRCTLVYGFFRKDILRKLLVTGENAWEFEIESGKRARGIPLLSIENKVFSHYHLLRKGVGMRPGYPKLKAQYPDMLDRPIESHFGYIKRELKELAFRNYHRLMPPKLIEKRENRRKM